MSAAGQVGFRNQLRAQLARAPGAASGSRSTIAIQFLVVRLLLVRSTTALGYGVAVVFTVLWLRRLPPLPWRLLVEAVARRDLRDRLGGRVDAGLGRRSCFARRLRA